MPNNYGNFNGIYNRSLLSVKLFEQGYLSMSATGDLRTASQANTIRGRVWVSRPPLEMRSTVLQRAHPPVPHKSVWFWDNSRLRIAICCLSLVVFCYFSEFSLWALIAHIDSPCKHTSSWELLASLIIVESWILFPEIWIHFLHRIWVLCLLWDERYCAAFWKWCCSRNGFSGLPCEGMDVGV